MGLPYAEKCIILTLIILIDPSRWQSDRWTLYLYIYLFNYHVSHAA